MLSSLNPRNMVKFSTLPLVINKFYTPSLFNPFHPLSHCTWSPYYSGSPYTGGCRRTMHIGWNWTGLDCTGSWRHNYSFDETIQTDWGMNDKGTSSSSSSSCLSVVLAISMNIVVGDEANVYAPLRFSALLASTTIHLSVINYSYVHLRQ